MQGSARASLPMTPTYFRLLIQNLGVPRKVIDAALAKTPHGASAVEDPGRAINAGEQLEVFGALVERLPAGWGLRAGRRFHVGTHGAMGFAFLSAPDLRASLAVLERFGPVRLPYVRARTGTRRGSRYALGFDVALPIDPPVRVAVLELAAMARRQLLESVLGESVEDARFDFDYPAPDYADLYSKELGTSVRFDQPESGITIPAEWLDRTCATGDPVMFAISMERLEARQRQLSGKEFVIAHVEEQLDSAGDAGLSVEEMSRELGMSRRSLTRRLAEAGTTYRAVRDAHRRDRAKMLFRDPNLEISEIAWRLGYRDMANFGRAARRWFGMAPGRYRRSLAETPVQGNAIEDPQ